MTSLPTPSPGLRRAVSRWEVVALSVNSVVGSGVYLVLPVAAARLLGPASIWAIFAAGFAVLLIVLCFAEAACHFDRPGGAHVYAGAAFGDFVGFEVGWMTWIARVAAVASLSVFFARALGYVWAGANGGLGQAATIVVELVALTWVNVRGVKAGARTTVLLTIGKLVPLAVIIAVGVFAVSWDRVFPVPAPDPAQFAPAALLVLYAYSGFEATAGPAGEFRNPQRDLPFALIVQVGLVTVVYTLVQLVAIGTVPNLGVSHTPLADAGTLLLGTAGGVLLTLGAAISVLGTNNGSVLIGPRYLYALADAGQIPRAFAKIHPRYHTPYVAILTQSGIALALIGADAIVHRINPGAFGVAEELAVLSVIARLVSYVATSLAVPVLRRKLPPTPASIRLPGGPAIPIAAVAISLLLFAAAERKVFVAGFVAMAVGALVYAAGRRAGGAAAASSPPAARLPEDAAGKARILSG